MIKQSFSATWHPGFTTQNNAVLNGDGFGLAWYHDGMPFLYKTTEPAWTDLNFKELAQCIQAPVICGHVRAASPGSIVSRENCHPFRYGRLTFQHNGHIEQFGKIKRRISNLLSDEAFHTIAGVTDSEYVFALLITNLKDPLRKSTFGAEELSFALTMTIGLLIDLLRDASITDGFTTCNFALSDGETVVTTRFCDKWPLIAPPSLYFAFPRRADFDACLLNEDAANGPGDGSEQRHSTPLLHTESEKVDLMEDRYTVADQRWREDNEEIEVASQDPACRALLVASEPSTAGQNIKWFPMPANSILVYTRGTHQSAERSRPILEHIPILEQSHTDAA